MARAVTDQEKTTFRAGRDSSRLYIAALYPDVVYSARLASVPSSTDMVAEITFTSGSGTLSNVKADMVMYVGTSAGTFDIGFVRIRKAPIAGTFYIGEQSKIDWQADCYLTVVKDFDLMAKHIHIDGTTPKMDWDISYSDQHEDFNPIPVLGPMVRVGKLVDGSVDIQLGPENGHSSYVIDSTISSYGWTCDSATFDNSAIADPIATIETAGWHLFYCTVTAANGKSRTSVRWVYTWDDENPPITEFKVNWGEDAEKAGISFGVEMTGECSKSVIRERALIVLFSEDQYGDSEGSIGPIEGAENILGVGRVIGNSVEYTPELGVASFEVEGFQYWFKQISGFPVGLELATNTPDAWTDMPELTVRRALWHLLEWRSTAITIMDVILTDDARLAPELQSLSSDLWSQMDEIAFSSILANTSVDMYGRLFAQIDPQMVPEDERDTYAVDVMDVTPEDLLAGIQFEERPVTEVSLIDLSGIALDEAGANPISIFSLSPGHVFLDYGVVETVDQLLLSSQSQGNQLAGLILGWRTSDLPNAVIKLSSNNRMISCFPNQYITMTIDADENPRGEEITARFIPRARRMSYDSSVGVIEWEISLEKETFERISVNGDVPGSEDTGQVPTPGFPPLPDLPPIVIGDISSEPEGPPVVVFVTATHGIAYTENFNGDTPAWKFWNFGISATDKGNIDGGNYDQCIFFQTPSGAWYLGIRENTFKRWFDKVYRATALGAKWEIIIDSTWLDANEGAGAGLLAMGFNPNKPDEIAFVAGSDIGGAGTTKHLWIGTYPEFDQGASFSCTNFSGNITYGSGKWVFDRNEASDEYWLRFSGDGSTLEYTSTSFGQGGIHWHRRAGTGPVILKSKPGVTGLNGLLRSEDNGDTWDEIDTGTGTPSDLSAGPNLAIAPDGLTMFSGWTAAAQRGRSFDGGYSWDGSFFVPGGYYCYAYCGGVDVESRWILGRGDIRLTLDGGDNWLDKRGNLPWLIPTSMVILKIVVPGYY